MTWRKFYHFHYKCICRLKMRKKSLRCCNEQQRKISCCSYVCNAFPFLLTFFLENRKGNEKKTGTKMDRKSRKAGKKYSCSCVLEWWKEREKKIVCECSIACDVYIMAFYLAGKIDSMIEQFSLSNTHSKQALCL